MRTGSSIVNTPLVLGVTLSIAAHATALYFRGGSEPARPALESGRTVVQLTLIPSIAATAQPAEPEPRVEPEPRPEPVAEPTPESTVEPEPIPAPIPTPKPTADPTPEPPTEKQPEAMAESIEQNASEIADKGVLIEAAPTSAIRASYPRSSQKRGHEGAVVLSIEVLASGEAGAVRILKSSGHKQLDNAAVKAAKKATYTPATRFGHSVDSELIQPIVFKLN